jgi:Ca-activated chloride channel family protein
MAESDADLQKQLNSFSDYCDIWRLKVNVEKSKININKYEKKTYYFHYPLGLALMLLFLYFWQRNCQ